VVETNDEFPQSQTENIVSDANSPVQQAISRLSAVKSVRNTSVTSHRVSIARADSSHTKRKKIERVMGPGGLTASVRLFFAPNNSIHLIPAAASRWSQRATAGRLHDVPDATWTRLPTDANNIVPCMCWLVSVSGRLEPCWGIAGIKLLQSKVVLGDALSRCRHWGRVLSLIRKPGSFCRSSIVEAMHWRWRCIIGRLAAASGSREGGGSDPRSVAGPRSEKTAIPFSGHRRPARR
jgi:hypothetical protein